MTGKRWENQYRNTVVCIDSYQDGECGGRIMNSSLSQPIVFHGVMQFLLETEKLLDDMQFPEPFNQTRRFRAAAPTQLELGAEDTAQGKLATFGVRILFRQNASWQGSVTWMEGRQEESFRSALELLLLMNSVLEQEQPASEAG